MIRDGIDGPAVAPKAAEKFGSDLTYHQAAETWWYSDEERRVVRHFRDVLLLERLRRTVQAFGPDTPVSSIDMAALARVRADMRASPSHRLGNPPSAYFIDQDLNLAARVLAHAARTPNPAAGDRRAVRSGT
jgi:hypothetical protein